MWLTLREELEYTHGSYCECDECEGVYRLAAHIPNICLFDGDQRRNDGGRGAITHRVREYA